MIIHRRQLACKRMRRHGEGNIERFSLNGNWCDGVSVINMTNACPVLCVMQVLCQGANARQSHEVWLPFVILMVCYCGPLLRILKAANASCSLLQLSYRHIFFSGSLHNGVASLIRGDRALDQLNGIFYLDFLVQEAENFWSVVLKSILTRQGSTYLCFGVFELEHRITELDNEGQLKLITQYDVERLET